MTVTGRSDTTTSALPTPQPAGTRMAQKWGFDRDTRANAAVVFGSTGDFILVIFMRKADWGDWQQASPIMADVTRASYDYFGMTQ